MQGEGQIRKYARQQVAKSITLDLMRVTRVGYKERKEPNADFLLSGNYLLM